MDEIQLLTLGLEALDETGGAKIESIKILRGRTGLGLVESKNVIDRIEANYNEIYNLCHPTREPEDVIANDNIDFENMSLEELQKYKEELERKRLIAELQTMNSPPKQPIIQVQKPITERPMTKKEIIKQNKESGIACCPKCGSTSLTTTNKKLSIGRAIVGGALINPVGALVGAVTSKKVYCICMNCGYKWKL